MKTLLLIGIVPIIAIWDPAVASAPNPDVTNSSPYAIFYDNPSAKSRSNRGHYVWVGRDKIWNEPVDDDSDGLSLNPDDCNRGCALSNGS
jgi:hypothetical protein